MSQLNRSHVLGYSTHFIAAMDRSSSWWFRGLSTFSGSGHGSSWIHRGNWATMWLCPSSKSWCKRRQVDSWRMTINSKGHINRPQVKPKGQLMGYKWIYSHTKYVSYYLVWEYIHLYPINCPLHQIVFHHIPKNNHYVWRMHPKNLDRLW